MKSVNIQLSELEFNQLGLKKSNLTLSELVEIIEKRLTKQTLEKSVRLASKYGLSNMTMDEINDEINAFRDEKSNP